MTPSTAGGFQEPVPERPGERDFRRRLLRARVVFLTEGLKAQSQAKYVGQPGFCPECGQPDDLHTHVSDTGWARIDGPWLHFLSDRNDRWRSLPLYKIVYVEWEPPDG